MSRTAHDLTYSASNHITDEAWRRFRGPELVADLLADELAKAVQRGEVVEIEVRTKTSIRRLFVLTEDVPATLKAHRGAMVKQPSEEDVA